tara:strand:- start:612 stop:6215 length:5604 start_codon:yes stop_codon:yes gene_type:complete
VPRFGRHLQFGSFQRFGSFQQGSLSSNEASNASAKTAPDQPIVTVPGGVPVRVAKLSTAGQEKILAQGGVLYEGQQVATRALRDTLEGKLVNYEIKMLIQDVNSRWVDLTDKATVNGKNTLMKLGSLTYTAERLRGQLQQSISNIVVDNSDGFWDKPFPSSLQCTYDTDFGLIDPTPAVFNKSLNRSKNNLFRSKIAIRISYLLTGDVIPNDITLGVFTIEDITCEYKTNTATLRLGSLSQPLIETPAESIKDGAEWYNDASAELLVKKILQYVYLVKADSSAPAGAIKIDNTWEIDNITSIDVPLEKSEKWVLSDFGRPKEKEVVGSNVVYNNPTERCSAIQKWEYSTGTVSVNIDSDIVTGSGTSWTDQVVAGSKQNAIKVGDSFIIAPEYYANDGGSTTTNDGYYTIIEVISSTQIRLDRPFNGKENETGLSYSIARIYAGIGPVLYEYNIARDHYTELLDLEESHSTSSSITNIEFTDISDDYPIVVFQVEEPRLNYNEWSNADDPFVGTTYPSWEAHKNTNATDHYEATVSMVKWDNTWSYSAVKVTGEIHSIDYEAKEGNGQHLANETHLYPIKKDTSTTGMTYGDPDGDILFPFADQAADEWTSTTQTTRAAQAEQDIYTKYNAYIRKTSRTTMPILQFGEMRRSYTKIKVNGVKRAGVIGGTDNPIFLPFKQRVISLSGGTIDKSPTPLRFFERKGDQYFSQIGYDPESEEFSIKETGSDFKTVDVVFQGNTASNQNDYYRIAPVINEGAYDVTSWHLTFSTFITKVSIGTKRLNLKYSLGGGGFFTKMGVNNHPSNGTKSQQFFCYNYGPYHRYHNRLLGSQIGARGNDQWAQSRTSESSWEVGDADMERTPRKRYSWYILSIKETATDTFEWTAFDYCLFDHEHQKNLCQTFNYLQSGVFNRRLRSIFFYTPPYSYFFNAPTCATWNDDHKQLYIGMANFHQRTVYDVSPSLNETYNYSSIGMKPNYIVAAIRDLSTGKYLPTSNRAQTYPITFEDYPIGFFDNFVIDVDGANANKPFHSNAYSETNLELYDSPEYLNNARVPYEIIAVSNDNISDAGYENWSVYVSYWNLKSVGNSISAPDAKHEICAYHMAVPFSSGIYDNLPNGILSYGTRALLNGTFTNANATAGDYSVPGNDTEWDVATDQYESYRVRTYTSNAEVRYKGNGFLQGFHVAYINGTSASDRKILFWDSSRQCMMALDAYLAQYDRTAVSNAPLVAQTNLQNLQISDIPETSLDVYQAFHPVYFSNINELYWIGSDQPARLHQYDGQGRYNLTKWSFRQAVRVDQADFSGMNCWEALGNLAEIANCRYGFYPDGRFFFKEKPRNKVTEYTITNNGTNGLLSSVAKDSGYRMIANSISKIPSKAVPSPISYNIVTVQESEYGKERLDEDGDVIEGPVSHSISIEQNSNKKTNIVLVCDQGGKIASSPTESSNPDVARFVYKVTKRYAETAFSRDHVHLDYKVAIESPGEVTFDTQIFARGNSQILLNDPDAVNTECADQALVGHWPQYANAGGTGINAEIFVRGYHYDQLSDSQYVQGDAIGDSVSPFQDRIVIGGYEIDWVVDLTENSTSLGEKIQRGAILALHNYYGNGKIEYVAVQGVTQTVDPGDTLKVVRGVYRDYPAIEIDYRARVYLISQDGYVYTRQRLSTDTNHVYKVGDRIQLIEPQYRDSADISDLSLTDEYAVLKPSLGKISWIGGQNSLYATGVGIIFSADSTANNYANHKFSKGDRISINSEGLVLQQDSASAQVAKDTRSIVIYGEKNNRGTSNNPFLNATQARLVSIRELNEFAHPRYVFTVDTIHMPWLTLDSIVTIENDQILPTSTQFKTDCYITQMQFDPQARAMVRLTLRSVDPF